jgi:Flp pilus assembly pilin Flp
VGPGQPGPTSIRPHHRRTTRRQMTSITLTYARLRAADGQTMTETAVLMALVFLVVLVALLIFSNALTGLWNDLSNSLPGS